MNTEDEMPAKSSKQRKAAGMALAIKRGKVKKSKARGAAKKMAQSISETQLTHFARKSKAHKAHKGGDSDSAVSRQFWSKK